MALHDRSGFSTAELLVVVAAGLIIVSAAVPFVHFAIDQFHLVLAAQGLVNQMQYTRMRAVSSNETFRLRLEPGTGQYQVELENGALHAGPFNLPDGVSLNHVDSDNPVSFPGHEVHFLPNGSVPVVGLGSGGRVKLINRAGLRVDVVVDSGGAVRITPTYKSPPAPF